MGCSGSKSSSTASRTADRIASIAPKQEAAASDDISQPQHATKESTHGLAARSPPPAPQSADRSVPSTVRHRHQDGKRPTKATILPATTAVLSDAAPHELSNKPAVSDNKANGTEPSSAAPQPVIPSPHSVTHRQPPAKQSLPAVTTADGYVIRDKTHEPLAGHARYRRIKDINSGASGFVQLAADLETAQEVAIKFVPRGSTYLQRSAEREILNHRLLEGHAHIVQFHQVFLTEKYLGIVMEYVNGGDLADLVDLWNARNRRSQQPSVPGQAMQGPRCLPEELARRLFQQLLVAVDFLHHLGIANRDIKLENALLAGDPGTGNVQVKLCDFGYSKDEMGESLCKTLCGTPEYIAPEVLIDNRYQGKISDIWSAGVLLYVILTGVFPFWRKDDEKLDSMTRLNRMFPRIVKAEYVLPSHVSPACRDLLARMLSVDTKRRMSVQSILQHPWFQDKLAPELLTMNSDLLALPATERIKCSQSQDEIRRIVRTAAIDPSKAGGSSSAASLHGKDRPSQGNSKGIKGSTQAQASHPDANQERLPSFSDLVDQVIKEEQ